MEVMVAVAVVLPPPPPPPQEASENMAASRRVGRIIFLVNDFIAVSISLVKIFNIFKMLH